MDLRGLFTPIIRITRLFGSDCYRYYYMVIVWLLYGYYMVIIWLLYGYYMVIIWLLYGYYMVIIIILRQII
jgi:hypothetical protein